MIESPQQAPAATSAEQFRVCRLQIYNWGTFSDLHDIPIAERGFLFVGRSGSGKTTLLDAFSAALVPPRWIDFNAAAREADRSGRDRNLVSYIRGAWAEQKDCESGEIATRYLRTGTTWSALALSYRNSLGRTVVLVQLFWLRGSANGSTDVRRHYLIFERPFELREMAAFDLDLRKLKQSFPEAFARDEFSSYCERFRRLLDIDTELALRLLHKTQSAKNLGDLNTFLRDFMLDKPETFEAADRLVSEFSELNAAHQAVVTAREQVHTLTPAREDHGRLRTLQLKQDELRTLKDGVDGYKENRRMVLLQERIEALNVERQGLDGEAENRKATLNNHELALDELRQRHRELGGDRIEHLEAEKLGLEGSRNECMRKRGQMQLACGKLGWSVPGTPHDFASLVAKGRQEVDAWPQAQEDTRQEQFALANQHAAQTQDFKAAVEEVEALRRQPSNIPAYMLKLRANVTAALGLAESALPFAGELIEVRPEGAAWRGAIERLLHGFALSLLVEERSYSAVSNFVNETHLRGRLVYFRVGRVDIRPPRPLGANSLFDKIQIRQGDFATWLESDLKQHFDYACVDTMQAFRNSEKALTRQGQIRHGKERHEKNDRFAIDDRSQWVLGFDNRDKLALFERRAQQLASAIEELSSKMRALTTTERERGERRLSCQLFVNIQWQEIDVVPLVDRISAIEQALKESRLGNVPLQEIAKRINEQKITLEKANGALVEVRAKIRSLEKETRSLKDRLEALRQTPSPLTPLQSTGLEERFAALNQPLTLDNADRCGQLVERTLGRELEEFDRENVKLVRAIEDRFAEFRRRWQMDAGDMDGTLASAHDYFAKLKRLETDGLPAYEQRFFDLLRNQSHQNLAALSTHISQARKTILDRMELVNESLSQAAFNVGTYLHIDASDRQLPEVQEFKQRIHQALSYAWTDDRENAEARFTILRELVERLGSQETEPRRWRETVLDVRQHVEFIGREVDSEGREVEVYRSGAGKSGGQRQKLATTCLAAALRYQLGGNNHSVPMYAPVVLDEAFDKADNEFTALAMTIFANFGFQMIVATPLKSVMTLEPFIGGACFVDIAERCRSSVLMIEYDSDRQRLKLPEHIHGDTHVAVS